MPKFATKGGKATSSSKVSKAGKESKDSKDDDLRFQIGNSRFISVGQFRNKVRVDIREFYLDDQGEKKPGKKGISLSLEEWEKFKVVMDDVDKAIKKLNEVPTDSESSSED